MQQIEIGNQLIDYEVIRTDRKTLGISLDKDKKLTVRSPKKAEDEWIRKVLKKKTSWILDKLSEVDKIKPAPKPKEFLSGEKLPYLGRRYRLKVKPDDEIDNVEVKLYHGKFIINCPVSIYNNDAERIDKIRESLIDWYREHAKIKINERVEKYKVQLDVEPNNVVIKKQKKRWGSCSSKNNLNFNWKIIIAPMTIVDYLVVHELTHLKHNNHSKEFWKTIEAIIPDYEERLEWLKINGRQLDF